MAAIIDATKDSEAPVEYTFVRDGEQRVINIQPKIPEIPKNYEKRLIGINFAYDRGEQLLLTHPSVLDQLKEASTIMWVSLSKVINSKTSIDIQHFSGPVGIGKSMFQMLTIKDGWKELIWFLVIFNVNLAIFNLLPFPVLDGGHIVLGILEWIRGKAVQLKVLEYIQSIFVVLLLTLFVFITSKDIGEFFPNKKKTNTPVEFLPEQ